MMDNWDRKIRQFSIALSNIFLLVIFAVLRVQGRNYTKNYLFLESYNVLLIYFINKLLPMTISTDNSKSFLGAISLSARRQSLDEFEHQTFTIEKKLEGAGLTTKRAPWSTCRYVGQQPGCKPVDLTVMVFGDERNCVHQNNMIDLGEEFDLDHVLLLTGHDGKFELHGTSKRRHAYPGYGSKVAILSASITKGGIKLKLPTTDEHAVGRH